MAAPTLLEIDATQQTLEITNSRDAISLRGRSIETGTPTDGEVMTYSTSSSEWIYQTITENVDDRVAALIQDSAGGGLTWTYDDSAGTLTPAYVGDSTLVTSGALNSGSITSGFSSIDVGSGAITTTGTVSATTLAGTLSTAAQTNITSVGALAAGSISSGFGTINIGSSALTAGAASFTTIAGSVSLALATGATVTGIDNGSLATSATLLATAGAIRTYVDAQVTAQDLDIISDSGNIDIDLDSESLTLAGGTGLASSASGTTVTFAIDSTVATLAGSQTLTNKTLTTPVISSISNTGTVTLPTSTDTLVGKATTDTLVNKSISGSTNTLSAIANGSLTNSTVAYGGVSLSLGGADTTPAFDLSDATSYPGDSSLVTTGTITSGTWQGTTVAVNQGGTGLASYTAGDIIYASGSTTLAKLAKGSDTDVLTLASGVPTWAAVGGDITGVTAGDGLSGGGSSGTVSLALDLNELTGATVDVASDSIAIVDANDGNASRKESITDLIAAIDGAGLTATSGVLAVDAAQTQITSVGALAAGSISSGFGAIDVGSSSIDGGTITGTFVGALTGNVTGNASGTAATVTGGTQAAITIAANLVTVGALASGSLASGFGNISIGSSTITGGAASFTTIAGSVSLALATGATVTGVDNGSLGSSATLLATQGAIKTYVDAQVTAQDLDITTDSGTIDIDLDSDTLTIAGGTGLASSALSTTVTFAIDSTVATLSGSQTLTNKTIAGGSNTLSAIANSSLTNSTVSYGGVSLALGASDATPAFDLSNATALPAAQVAQGTMASGMILVAPALGTPASGTATNITGLPIVAGTTGTLTLARGGTGFTGYAKGDIIIASATDTLAKLGAGSDTQVLTLASGAPTWAAPSAGAAAAGTLTGATLASGVTASSLTSVGTLSSLVVTTADINAGTFDGIVGGTTPADGSFTTLSASSTSAFTGVSTFLDDIVVGATQKIRLDGDAGGDTYLGESSTDTIRLLVGGSIAIQSSATEMVMNTTTLEHNGNVGIGASPGSGALKIREADGVTALAVEMASATGDGIIFEYYTSSPDNNVQYFFRGLDNDAGGTNRVYIYSDGDGLNHDGTWGTISDESLKVDVLAARSQWEDIKWLGANAVNYRMKTDGPEGKEMLGWGAQSVHTAGMGGLVMECGEGDEAFLGLRTSIIHTKAVIALGEAMSRIEALETALAAL